jgi:hypothetical protein
MAKLAKKKSPTSAEIVAMHLAGGRYTPEKVAQMSGHAVRLAAAAKKPNISPAMRLKFATWAMEMAANVDHYAAVVNRSINLRKKYGLTVAEVETMFTKLTLKLAKLPVKKAA